MSTEWLVDIWRDHVSDWQNRIGAQFPRAFFSFPLRSRKLEGSDPGTNRATNYSILIDEIPTVSLS